MLKSTVALAALMAVPALAQGESPVIVEGGLPTAVVSYADLDLSSSNGLATLSGRISRAASRICTESGRKELRRQLSEARCFRTAIQSAQPQVERIAADSSERMASSGTIRVAAR